MEDMRVPGMGRQGRRKAARLTHLSPTSLFLLLLQGIMSDGAEMYMHMIIKFYSYLLRSRKL